MIYILLIYSSEPDMTNKNTSNIPSLILVFTICSGAMTIYSEIKTWCFFVHAGAFSLTLKILSDTTMYGRAALLSSVGVVFVVVINAVVPIHACHKGEKCVLRFCAALSTCTGESVNSHWCVIFCCCRLKKKCISLFRTGVRVPPA